MSYECILTETRVNGDASVGLITLNRPKQLNALNDTLMDELGAGVGALATKETTRSPLLPRPLCFPPGPPSRSPWCLTASTSLRILHSE